MGIFSEVAKLGADAGRQKVALSEVKDPEDLSFLERHPALAGALGGGVGRGIGTGLIGGAARHALTGLKPGDDGLRKALTFADENAGRLGTGFGTAAGHYLATRGYGGDLGRSAVAGTLAGALARPGMVDGPYSQMHDFGAGLVGAGIVGAPDAERAHARYLESQGKQANDMYMTPEEEMSWAEQHPMIAGAGRAVATGLGGGLGAYGARRLMPHLPGAMTSTPARINATGYGLPALGGGLGAGLANYATGGDGMEAGIAGLGAGLGQFGADYAAANNGTLNSMGRIGPGGDFIGPPQPGHVRGGTVPGMGHRSLSRGAHFGGGAAAGGAAASGITQAARKKKKDGEKQSEDEMVVDPSFAERHPLLARLGRNVATGLGGAAGHAAGTYGLGAAAGRGWASHPSLAYVAPGAGAALGAAGANYLAGGDAMSAGISGLGAGIGSAGGLAFHQRQPAGTVGMTNGFPDPRESITPVNYVPVHHHWGSGAAAGGMLADAGMQAFER